jgi:hypothetical protein
MGCIKIPISSKPFAIVVETKIAIRITVVSTGKMVLEVLLAKL